MAADQVAMSFGKMLNDVTTYLSVRFLHDVIRVSVAKYVGKMKGCVGKKGDEVGETRDAPFGF